jgi:hypothetical protein
MSKGCMLGRQASENNEPQMTQIAQI